MIVNGMIQSIHIFGFPLPLPAWNNDTTHWFNSKYTNIDCHSRAPRVKNPSAYFRACLLCWLLECVLDMLPRPQRLTLNFNLMTSKECHAFPVLTLVVTL